MTLRTLVWTLVALGLVALVVAALTGLLLILALVVALGVLNLVYLPRLARYFRIPVGWLAVALIPFMILAGAVIGGGTDGAIWGVGIWMVAIGLPRAIGKDVARRARQRISTNVTYIDVTQSATRRTEGPAGRPLPPADGPTRGEFGL